MYQRILVPVDGSSTAQRGLHEAIGLAKLTGGRIRLMHVVDELSFALAADAYAGLAGDWLDELRKGAAQLLGEAAAQAARQGVGADTVLIDRLGGAVHEQVIAEAQACGADLIVVGTHGRRGIGRWVMGSSAEQIVRTAPVPVLLVRAAAEAQREHERFPLSSRVLASL